MILVWNDAASFNRHLEMMKVFRRSHPASVKVDWNLLKDMPVLEGVQLKNDAGGVNRQFDTGSRPVMVPIQKIAMPGNYQN
jgi:hypothetical protein